MITPELVRKALNIASVRRANYEYFFERLTSPDWIEPLFAHGRFQDPPPMTRSGDLVSFPFWPESRYLARVAGCSRQAAESVLRIALQINTDNVRVHEDLADAALALPADLAAQLVPKARNWLRSPYQLLLPEKLGALVKRLAEGGQVDAALDLAEALLAVRLGSRPLTRLEEEHGLRADPEGHFDEWQYEQILEKDIPALVNVAGLRAFELLSRLLAQAVSLSEDDRAESCDDSSYVWRPSIEQPSEFQRDARNALVTAIRDSAHALVRNNDRSLPQVISTLEKQPRLIFRRLVLYILWKFSEVGGTLIGERLANRSNFNEHGLRYEYDLLAQKAFSSLSAEQQRTILLFIEEGPNLSLFRERWEEWNNKRPLPEEERQWVARWTRDRLAPIAQDLPVDWKLRYEQSTAEFGQASKPEPVAIFQEWVGPTSPKTADELETMSVEETVAFLRSWHPSHEPMSPSPEGLGRALQNVIASNPQRFVDKAHLFEGLQPTYVRAFFEGLQRALGQKKEFSWEPVIKLAKWTVDRPYEAAALGSRYDDADPHWGWARATIASLLTGGFGTQTISIPFALRRIAWEALLPITEDPDPTRAEEIRRGYQDADDPLQFAINTTRGKAIEAVVAYAWWVRNQYKTEGLECGFDAAEEVRTVLNRHLDPDIEPTMAIRAIYGRSLPWLFWLDKEWFISNLTNIFSHDREDLRNAAWNTYVLFCSPDDRLLESLRDYYRQAIDRIASSGEKHTSPDKHLMMHLMAFLIRGKLDASEPDGLIRQFYQIADNALRRRASEFVGRSLRQIGEPSPEMLERLKAFWEWRIQEARPAELAAFGCWFGSGQFDDDWAMHHLKKSLATAGYIECDYLVMPRLAALAEDMPQDAVTCLDLMVKDDKQGWGIHSWGDEARAILKAAMNSGNEVAQANSENLLHYLAARGFYREFRDLLKRQQ